MLLEANTGMWLHARPRNVFGQVVLREVAYPVHPTNEPVFESLCLGAVSRIGLCHVFCHAPFGGQRKEESVGRQTDGGTRIPPAMRTDSRLLLTLMQPLGPAPSL